MRERNGVAVIIIDTRDPQDHRRAGAALCFDDLFRFGFRARVIPFRFHRRVLRNPFTWRARRVQEHRAAEDELLDLKLHLMERSEQSFRAADRDLVVQRARLTRKIVVRRQVNDRSQP